MRVEIVEVISPKDLGRVGALIMGWTSDGRVEFASFNGHRMVLLVGMGVVTCHTGIWIRRKPPAIYIGNHEIPDGRQVMPGSAVNRL